MVVTRISSYNLQQNTLGNAIGVQAKLFELQNQISSGYKTSTFQGLFGEVEAYTSLDDKIQRTDQYMKNNAITSSRINLMLESSSAVRDVATQARNIILTRRNDTGGENGAGFVNQMQQLWITISGELNASVEGRYLFGGIRTDTPPVDNTFPSLENDSNSPEDSYYQGAKSNTQIRLQDDYDIPITARADDVSVQNIFAAFATAVEGHNNNDDTLLARAYDLMSQGLDDLGTMEVDLATIQVNMDNVAARQDKMMLYWRGVKENIVNTDLVSASTEVATNQGILQAAFQSFARINQLNLSDFLR